MSYALIKFRAAVQSVGNASSKKDWLTSEDVYRVVRLRQDDLPAHLRQDFAMLQRTLSNAPMQSVQDSIEATVEAMSVRQVNLAIALIIGMHEAINYFEAQAMLSFNFGSGIDHAKLGLLC